MRNEQAAVRPGDAVGVGIFAGDGDRPGVAVDHADGAEHERATDGGEEILRPHRPLREAKALALLARIDDGGNDCDAGEGADDPAPRRADRTFGAAAHQAKGRVHGRDRAAAGDEPSGAAPDEKATERDDEGGNVEEGDDRAVQRADGSAQQQAGEQREDPRGRVVEAQDLRQDFSLQHTHDHADETEDGADRQIDIAGDDDQHHAGCHDGDGRRLNGEVPQVARCQEQAARQNVEADPDDQQGTDHAKQARVDFGGAKEALHRVLACRSRAIGCGIGDVGHGFAVPSCLLNVSVRAVFQGSIAVSSRACCPF